VSQEIYGQRFLNNGTPISWTLNSNPNPNGNSGSSSFIIYVLIGVVLVLIALGIAHNRRLLCFKTKLKIDDMNISMATAEDSSG